jgi:hypothetical protein
VTVVEISIASNIAIASAVAEIQESVGDIVGPKVSIVG